MITLKTVWRSLLRNRVSSVGAIAAFAVAILSNALAWSISLPLLVDPLPYPAAHQIVRITQTRIETPDEHLGVAYGNLLLWQQRASTISAVGGYARSPRDLLIRTSDGVGFESVEYASVTLGFFETLGGVPQLGRLFQEEDWPSGLRALIISDKYWRQRFGADPAVIGRKVEQPDGRWGTIIGVMPPDFAFPVGTSVWTPAYLPPALLSDQNSRAFSAIARMKPGVRPSEVAAEIRQLQRQIGREFPKTEQGWVASLELLRETLLGPSRGLLVFIQLMAALLIVVAFMNVAVLLTVHAHERRSAVAVQAALGASATRLISAGMLEGLVIASVGCATGLAAAHWLVATASSWLPASVAMGQEFAISPRAVSLALTVAIAAAVGWGWLSKRALASFPLTTLLACRTETATTPQPFRTAAIVAQMSVAVVVLLAALVATNEIRRRESTDPGFVARDVVTSRVFISVPRLNRLYATLPSRLSSEEFVIGPGGNELDHRLSSVVAAQDLISRVREVPGVEVVALSGSLPLTALPQPVMASVPGLSSEERQSTAADRTAVIRIDVSEEYFRAMRIRIVRGRPFDSSDRLNTEAVAIVTEDLAARMRLDPATAKARIQLPGEVLRVVGVTSSIALARIGDLKTPVVYRPFSQSPSGNFRLIVRSKSSAARLHRIFVRTGDDLGFQLFGTRAMKDIVDDSLRTERSAAASLAALAFLCGTVAFVGLFGLMTAVVELRQREFAIRVALGATPATILRSVATKALAVVLVGTGIGITIGLTGGELFHRTGGLPQVQLKSALVAALLVVFVGLIAGTVSVWRLQHLDPATLLR